MADRKATNRSDPPEFWDDPKFGDKSNLNSFRGESWRNRGAQVNSKLLTQGRNVIRFETPFDIWCEGCNQVIHKGVRFNADKEKVRMSIGALARTGHMWPSSFPGTRPALHSMQQTLTPSRYIMPRCAGRQVLLDADLAL